MPGTFRPQVLQYRTPVWAAHPVSQWMASAIGRIWGKGISGGRGTIIYGYPQIGMRAKFQGYAYPQQMFTGWNPSTVAGGRIIPSPGGLPGTQAPYANTSPLLAAVANIPTGN
jgi:hypothetical protein